MNNKTMLIEQLEKVIVLLNQKRIEEPKEMLDLIISKYEKARKIINSKSDSEIAYEELSINGSIRAYLEAYTDWLNPMLGEMDKAEKMVKTIIPLEVNMDVKFGEYVTYKSKEYKAIRTGDQIEILSQNPEDRFNGFFKYSDDIYTKTPDLNEITAANRVKTITQYKGRKFLLFGSIGHFSIVTSSSNFKDHELLDWGFKQFNKGEYKLENVRLDQLEKIWEEREPIWQDIIKNKRDLWKL